MKKTGKKLWGGRFSAPTDKRVELFTGSTHYENRLVPFDIQGSLAHVRMLGRQKLVSAAEAAKIARGLNRILSEWKAGRFTLDPAFEDVHGNVEARLKSLIGPVAGKLHTGRSRNDQIALDERLYLKAECRTFQAGIRACVAAFIKMAEKHLGLVMPGYTHLQRAQPVLFSHWCLAYVEMLLRDLRRVNFCLESLDECPLGSGALAGSPLPLDRAWVARELGFARPTANSMDSVSDRDYLLDLASAMATLMIHFSRLGEELVIFNSQEFGFIVLEDAFATGSSLMPQKKNPDVAELMRGRASRTSGLLVQLLVLLKGQPLAYNRDMQEDKEVLFSTIDMVQSCLGLVPGLLSAIQPQAGRMEEACKQGYMEATDAADFLVKKGVAFREAHEAVGAVVQYCIKNGLTLEEVKVAQWKTFHPQFDQAVTALMTPRVSVSAKKTFGGTSLHSVKEALRSAKWRLKNS